MKNRCHLESLLCIRVAQSRHTARRRSLGGVRPKDPAANCVCWGVALTAARATCGFRRSVSVGPMPEFARATPIGQLALGPKAAKDNAPDVDISSAEGIRLKKVFA